LSKAPDCDRLAAMQPAPAPECFPVIRLPDWLGRDAQADGFGAGAVLALMHLAQVDPAVPQALWRARLALAAAVNAARLSNRPTREADLRDALCLLRPGEHPGPVGEMALLWARLVERPLSGPLSGPLWQMPRQGNPVAQAAQMLADALRAAPGDKAGALALADAGLARALGWGHVVPLLGMGMAARDLRDPDPARACHRAILRAGTPALAQAADLARRTRALQAIAPRLRAKAAGPALALFVARDATAPAHLRALMSERAARRLCDRLVALGALRELSGRDMFRLYGL
jgi:hypothetical protein